MAGFRKLKGYYYARVWVNGKERTIPLKTNQIRQASIRRSTVEKYESEIKAVMNTYYQILTLIMKS